VAGELMHAPGVVAFDRETDFERLDYQLMMRGPVRLVHSRTLLNTTVG
jgi:hypothetical protein